MTIVLHDAFHQMMADMEDAFMYGPKTMARFAERRRVYLADRRRRKRHARYNRGRTGVRPRMRSGR